MNLGVDSSHDLLQHADDDLTKSTFLKMYYVVVRFECKTMANHSVVIVHDDTDEDKCVSSKRHSLHAVELSQRSGKPCANCVDPSYFQQWGLD